jgi:hypothetical protein
MLQIVLIIAGLTLLVKRKMAVSSKRELSGTPAVFLALFFFLMVGVIQFVSFGFSQFIVYALLLIVTIVVIVKFSKVTLRESKLAQ